MYSRRGDRRRAARSAAAARSCRYRRQAFAHKPEAVEVAPWDGTSSTQISGTCSGFAQKAMVDVLRPVIDEWTCAKAVRKLPSKKAELGVT